MPRLFWFEPVCHPRRLGSRHPQTGLRGQSRQGVHLGESADAIIDDILGDAILVGCRRTRANPSGADLSGAFLIGTILTGVNRDTICSGMNLIGGYLIRVQTCQVQTLSQTNANSPETRMLGAGLRCGTDKCESLVRSPHRCGNTKCSSDRMDLGAATSSVRVGIEVLVVECGSDWCELEQPQNHHPGTFL